MMFRLTPLSLCLLAGLFIRSSDTPLSAQTNLLVRAAEAERTNVLSAEVELPDAPRPQTLAMPQNPSQKPDPATPAPVNSSSSTSSSGTSSSAPQSTTDSAKPDD